MNKIKFAVFIILAFSTFAFSQTTENDKIEISVCQPSIKEAGRASTFRFNYTYRVVSDKDGLIKQVKEISDNKNYRNLMNDEKVIPCIEQWKLKPSENYFVMISVGTTGGDNFLSISSKTVKIKLIL